MINTQNVIEFFNNEFGSLHEKFEIIVKSISEVRNANDDFIWKPGCYVWWDSKQGPIKVGRSLSNSRKRALEHLSADYKNIEKNTFLANMKSNPNSKLILFNIKDEKDLHWVAAVEIFLERNINPKIPCNRIG
jgi:hypothetical protein